MSKTVSAKDASLVEVVRGRHHIRCNNVENDTCGNVCYMICLGNKILATTPGVSDLDRHVADFIAGAFNTQRLAAKIAEGHYGHTSHL